MKEVHVCLKDCEGKLFITPERKQNTYSPEINPRIDKDREDHILREFYNANFIRINDELFMAETDHYNFRRYSDDLQDETVWIDEK
ncbi:MAG: hypothetical protein HC905_09385 [Bacteroidales bacterium]|nr:hypothetical protein [Bacteroidales bacterium]